MVSKEAQDMTKTFGVDKFGSFFLSLTQERRWKIWVSNRP